MSEPKLISPLLDNFVMGAPISDHHGVRCCPAMTKDSDKRYIVKIISIPASQVQLDALLLAGAYSSQASALAYFKELAAGVAQEAEILKKLSRFEGFVPYEDLQISVMEGKVGYDVYLLSPYKRSLERTMRKKPMTHLNAVNLGLDLCASMVMCRRAGYLYVDLKPGNIFLNDKQEYRVGDLGFVKLDSLKYASLPDKYRSPYTAPEVSDAWSSLNDTIDTYAIGMILYQVYNDGKLPFDTQAGSEPLPAPMYADYEMAEIILKAIAPDPADRWPDPMQMGQALVSYMQRNGVNDVPIVPLPVQAEAPAPSAEPESVPEEEAPEAAPVEESEPAPAEPVAAEPEETAVPVEDVPAEPEDAPQEDISDLSFMDDMVSDDTTPDSQSTDDITYGELSEETSDILAQVDELIAHETPEPVVAPEPIEVPIPAPIVLKDETEHEEEPAAVLAADPNAADSDEEIPADEAGPPEDAVQEPADGEPADEEEDDEPTVTAAPRKRRGGGIIAAIILILLLLAGLAGGYYYYNNYYLQTIDSLELRGQENDLDVLLTTDTDESLLTVVCTDSYGNTLYKPVVDGKASFTDLNPNTIYKISVEIEGFHELRGDISDNYTTPAQTSIIRFDAVAGSEDGSVILTFDVDGQDTNNWTVTYTAEGENEQTVTFSGHLVTINGLSQGKEYTFHLSSADDLYIVGTDTVTFVPAAPIFARDLTITNCTNEGLTAVWSAPEGVTVNSWTVRCYSEEGYDETIETSELTVTFTGIDPTQTFTVEVIAEGMTSGVRDYVTGNSATITGFTADTSEPMALTLSWEFTGTAPQGGWLVIYSTASSDQQSVIQTEENSVTIYPAMPGDAYSFTVQAADGTTVFDGTYECEAGPVVTFSGYGITASNMTFHMVRTPGNEDWTWDEVSRADYTNTFASGENASFIVELNRSYDTSDDLIEVLFVVSDLNGNVISTSTSSSSWTYMWSDNHCELDIPSIPTEPGRYRIAVYFNGMAASQDVFTITEG